MAGSDQVLRRDHDLLTPFARARPEDGFFNETRLEEGSESSGLPAKGGDKADHISRCLLHDIRLSHPDVP